MDAKNFQEAYEEVQDRLDNLARSVNAALMTMYPDRGLYAEVSREALEELNTSAVEVNVIVGGKQWTMIHIPGGGTAITRIRDIESFCVLPVGYDKTMSTPNVEEDDFFAEHFQKDNPDRDWKAWCSAPIRVNGSPVGTVCALDSEVRDWSDEEAAVLQRASKLIGKAVEGWAEKQREINEGK